LYTHFAVELRTKAVVALYDKTSSFQQMKQLAARNASRRLRGKPTVAASVPVHSKRSDKDKTSAARRLDGVYPDLDITVRDVNTDDLLYHNMYAYPEDVAPEVVSVVDYTAQTNYMFRSISNQEWLSFQREPAPLDIYLYFDIFSAVYSFGAVAFSNGMVTDDITANAWGRGYTEYSSGLIYIFQSGAINAAMSDM
jgi:hypothetical protein